MKMITGITAFLLSAVTMFVSLQRRHNAANVDSDYEITTTNKQSWIEANRRPVNDVFFLKGSSVTRQSKPTAVYHGLDSCRILR